MHEMLLELAIRRILRSPRPAAKFYQIRTASLVNSGLPPPEILPFNSLNFEIKVGTFFYLIDFDPRDDT